MTDEKALSRASKRITDAAKQALTPEKMKAALATKLVAAGLALTCLAGGVDYFNRDDAIHKAVAGIASDAGAADVASMVGQWDEGVDQYKADALEKLPTPLKTHIAEAALLAGVLALGAGIRMKIVAAGDEPGHVMRDVGRMIAGPGFVGIGLFAFVSWRGALVLRSATASFLGKLFHGEMSARDVFDLSTNYAPWAWQEVGGVLLMGLGFAAIWLALVFAPRYATKRWPTRPRILLSLAIARRTVFFAALLSLVHYAAATIVAIMSYGGALRVLAWPWKIDPGAFVVALAFMSFGLGLARTGTAELKREAKAAGK